MSQIEKVYTQGEFFRFMEDIFMEKHGFPAEHDGVWYGGWDSDVPNRIRRLIVQGAQLLSVDGQDVTGRMDQHVF